MARVAMIVWNEFRHDARVLKEAETLQAAGHSVTVHALHTPGVTRAHERLGSGVRVSRVPRTPLTGLRRRLAGEPRYAAGEGRAAQPAAASPNPGNPGFAHQIVRLGMRSVTHMRLCWRLMRARADVIHAHDVNTLPTAFLAALVGRGRLVYDAHEISTDREGYRGLRKVVGWVEKRLMPRAAATITTTDARARFFARAYRIPRPLVLQNRPRFHVPARTDLIRQELGLTDTRPIVVYQGGLQTGRGLERLVDAAAAIENAHFVLIGSGRLEGALKERVALAGSERRVHFIPAVPLERLPAYTASADIGVQAIENTCLNHFTTDSNKLFEYMMAGLPVVASDLPEIRKVVEAGDFGRLVPPGDTDALAGALRGLIDDARKREALAARAREAAERFNWEAQEPALVGLYERVLEGCGK